MTLAVLGYCSDNPFNQPLTEVTVDELRKLGLSYTQSSNKITKLKARRTSVPKAMRSDCYLAPENDDKRDIVEQYLVDDRVSTISDRTDDIIKLNGAEEKLRFLNKSVLATYLGFKDETGMNMSQTVFRKQLLRLRYIKTNERARKTALCRLCVQASSFRRSIETYAPEELQDMLIVEEGVHHWWHLFYCARMQEECYQHSCLICGGDRRMTFFITRVDWWNRSDEFREAFFKLQVWLQIDNVWMPKTKEGTFQSILPELCLFVSESRIARHERNHVSQQRFAKYLKGFDVSSNEVTTVASKNHVLVIWDHSMRPATMNNRELSARGSKL